MVQAMADDKRSKALSYGEPKKPKQFLLTDTASAQLDKISERLGITRSECIERMIRWVDEKWDSQLVRDLSADVEGDRHE